MREWKLVVRAAVASIALLTAAGFAAGAVEASAANVRLVDVELEVVPNPATDRGDATLDQAIVGDTITLLPVLELTAGESVDPFEIEIYYVERHTGRSGQVGIGWFPGLSGEGAVSRPAVPWLLVDQAPGHYDLFIFGPFETALVDDQGDPLDISVQILTPRLFLELYPTEGRVNFLELGSCPMGDTVQGIPLILAGVVNLGTQTVEKESLVMQLEYRLRESTEFQQYEGSVLTTAPSQDDLKPGEAGQGYLQIVRPFRPGALRGTEYLGTGYDLQFRLSLIDRDSNFMVSQPVIDTPRRFLTFHSAADAWTYPERPGCRTEEDEPGVDRKQVAMQVLDNYVYHLTTELVKQADGNTVEGQSFLGATSVLSGSAALADWSPEAIDGEQPKLIGLKVVPPEGGFGTATVYLTAAVGADGYVYAVEVASDTASSGALLVGEKRWRVGPTVGGTALGGLQGAPITFVDNTGERVVVVSSPDRVFTLRASDGGLRWQELAEEPMLHPPVAVTMDDGPAIWFAGGDKVYRYVDDLTSPDERQAIPVRDEITTPLVVSAGGTRVFFGGEKLHSERTRPAANSTIPGSVSSADDVGVSEITGITVVNGDDDVFQHVVVYATTARGIHRLEYNPDDEVFESTETLPAYGGSDRLGAYPTELSLQAPVGVLLGETISGEGTQIDAVFVVSAVGELRAYSDSFDSNSQIEIWGTTQDESANQNLVDFRFNSVSKGKLSPPIVYYGTSTNYLLTQSEADGLLYAFSLRTFEGGSSDR